jgi:hypothetical protein
VQWPKGGEAGKKTKNRSKPLYSLLLFACPGNGAG